MNGETRIPLSRSLVWFLSILVLVSIGSAQGVYDRSTASFKKDRKQAVLAMSEPLLPSAKTLKATSLGFRSALADLLWLQTIQYFGSGNPYGKYPSLSGMLDTITQLDPKFAYPYEFALVVLPFMDQAEQALTLGERAQATLPGNGLLTFYLASVYHLNFKDYRQAAKYYEKAAGEPGAPTASTQLAGVAYGRVNENISDRVVAIEFWKAVFENAKSDDEKERAKNWYAHMQIVYSLELAAEQYQKNQGKYPGNLDDLVKAGYISRVPESPIERLFAIDPATGKVSYDEVAQPQN